MLRIRDILVQIRICTSDKRIRILIFSSVTLKTATKNYIYSKFLLLLLLKYIYIPTFKKIKSHTEVTKQ
jgi:hypothetical protein